MKSRLDSEDFASCVNSCAVSTSKGARSLIDDVNVGTAIAREEKRLREEADRIEAAKAPLRAELGPQIIARRDEGMTDAQIAMALGISRRRASAETSRRLTLKTVVGYPVSWSPVKYRFAQRIGLFDRNACAATLCARRASVRLTDFTIASAIALARGACAINVAFAKVRATPWSTRWSCLTTAWNSAGIDAPS
jgi:hypothetical protein